MSGAPAGSRSGASPAPAERSEGDSSATPDDTVPARASASRPGSKSHGSDCAVTGTWARTTTPRRWPTDTSSGCAGRLSRCTSSGGSAPPTSQRVLSGCAGRKPTTTSASRLRVRLAAIDRSGRVVFRPQRARRRHPAGSCSPRDAHPAPRAGVGPMLAHWLLAPAGGGLAFGRQRHPPARAAISRGMRSSRAAVLVRRDGAAEVVRRLDAEPTHVASEKEAEVRSRDANHVSDEGEWDCRPSTA